jgi:hypothetical protein
MRNRSETIFTSVVRLQNPLLFLEHGLQMENVYLRLLMWVMGLDMLLMAGNIGPFVDRIEGLVRGDSYIFPPVHSPGRQPRLLVKEVAKDVYELRNVIAHGREVPKTPFRVGHELLDVDGRNIYWQPTTYAETLANAALFLLSRSLEKIFLEGWTALVESEHEWKSKLKIMENSARSRRRA